MGAAVEFTVHNVRARIWNKGMMDAYLRTCAISTSVREHVWRQCRPATSSEKSAEIEQTSVLLEAIGVDSQYALGAQDDVCVDGKIGSCDGEISGDYAPVSIANEEGTTSVLPLLWLSSICMRSYIDCGMHLVFPA